MKKKDEVMNPVEAAFRHVQSIHPTVTHVFYGKEGQWTYTNDNLQPVGFGGKEDVDLLVIASAAVEDYWPCAYYYGPLNDEETEDESPVVPHLFFTEIRKGEIFSKNNQDFCKVSSKKAVCISKKGKSRYGKRVYFEPNEVVLLPTKLLKG